MKLSKVNWTAVLNKQKQKSRRIQGEKSRGHKQAGGD